jgi:tetratricopeptide (TPR) repeat protein
MHVIAAGAWLGAKDSARALGAYEQSRQAAAQALGAGDETGGHLIMQSWFGEAGVWISGQRYVKAADAYLQAAAAAKAISHTMFEMEGLRCAAKCWWMHGDRERATECALNALETARHLPEAERANSIVGLLLQDLLVMNHAPAAQRLGELAQAYEKELAKAQKQADLAVKALGRQASIDAVNRIDSALCHRYEQAFSNLLREREKVIDRANKNFKAVISLGRAWLSPSWSGIPEVMHPLEKAPEQWTNPPVYAVPANAQAAVEIS